jgi:hypothetical protein
VPTASDQSAIIGRHCPHSEGEVSAGERSRATLKRISTLEAVLIIAVIAGWVGSWGTLAVAKKVPAPPSPVPQTGQTTSYGPEDDGAIQAGVEWPTPRFIDNRNGTVLDNLTGLLWLKQANCFGFVMWAQALTAANALASPNCGLTDGSVVGDWRLPNVKELQSLIDFGFMYPPLSNAAGTGQWPEGDAFSNVATQCYWSSTTRHDLSSVGWWVGLDGGETIGEVGPDFADKSVNCAVWPVRGGR